MSAAAHYLGAELARLLTVERERDELGHATRRMLQALDAYWSVYEGGVPAKWRHPMSGNLDEHWWEKFERYRGRVEAILTAK